jgi:glycolate oxidase iron-sulfur subunit
MTADEGRRVFSPGLLDACIACGFCLPACPTYELTGQEQSSPRGRIALMRGLEAGRLPADDATLMEESSFCLGCRACETVCPAGVEYGHLLEEWREHQWADRKPLVVRLLLVTASRSWPLRVLGRFRRHARPRPGQSGSVMLGCFERLLYPELSRRLAALDPALGVDAGAGCCGALHAHNGELTTGRAMARRMGERLPGVIVTTSGGCAAHLADVLGRDRVAESSEWITARARDHDVELRVGATTGGRRPRVALQDSCHLRNGLGVWREPRELLAQVAEYVELPDAARCCGSAGSYSLVRRRDSRAILGPKLQQIAEAEIDYVVAVNAGCLRQLRTGLRRTGATARAVHLVELVRLERPEVGTPLRQARQPGPRPGSRTNPG